jgi:hypothetical protein
MQYSNNPTLHRYLPTRAILLAELEALRADAMSRKSKLNIYGLTPLPSDNENLVFANENMVAVTAEIALLTDAIVATGLGVASSRSIHPLHAAATMLHPEFGRFSYVKDDSVRARLLADGEEMLRALAQQTAEGQKEAAVAADKEAADKEAAAKEAASGCISGSSSKGAVWTTGGAYGLLLSHSVNEADVVVADKRDEVARMLQYNNCNNSRSSGVICPTTATRLCSTGTGCEALSRSYTPLPCASSPSTRPSRSLREISQEPERR